MAGLDDISAAVQAVAGTAGPAVVGIGQAWGTGSGVVIGDGLVLTNAHNAGRGEVTIAFGGDRTVQGHVAGIDVDGELAVISADTSGVTPLQWADTPAELGTVVFGLANPGGRGLRVTAGLVSSVGRSFRGPRGRRVTGTIEHTAPLVRGSSGGPIVDGAGRFLGLNTNRLGEGFYAALPADADLRTRVDALARGESASRLHLGVGLLPGRAARQLRRSVGLPDRDGVLVRVVEDDSPADRAGLRPGDLIVSFDGRTIASPSDLGEAVLTRQPGDTVDVVVQRNGDRETLQVTLGTRPDEPVQP